jgi:hypothetical protein
VTQLFRRGADSLFRLVLAAIALGGIGIFLPIGGIMTSVYITGVGATPAQPVPFSHAHHAAQLGIDCRYCHSSVETAAGPGDLSEIGPCARDHHRDAGSLVSDTQRYEIDD